MRKVLPLLLVVVLLVSSLVACAPKQETVATEAATEPLLKIVFLITQPLSPFEQDIWTYVQKAKDDGLASEVKLIEMKDPSEYEQTFRQVSEEGYGVVISTFFFVKDAMLKVAKDFPNTHYVLVYEPVPDPVTDYPNVEGILYDVQEGSYVCGVVGAMMTQTNEVGFFGGDDSPGIVKFLAGYEAGLKSINPDIVLDIAFAGAFTDPNKGHEIAISQYEKGADIVMHAANKTGLGLFVAAKELGKYAIGVDIDQTSEAPENVICSALTNPGSSVYKAIMDVAEGKWTGGNVNWGIDDGESASAINTAIVPADVVEAALAAEEDIRSGKVTVPTTTDTR
jgi:basic membrane protein A